MLNVPPHILDALKCIKCDGFLITTPIFVTTNLEQVCGKCYIILPKQEQEKCFRQVAFETVAGLIQFPCKYYKSGCPQTFKINEENIQHEQLCEYKYKHLLIPVNNTIEDNFYPETDSYIQTEQIAVWLKFNLEENLYSPYNKRLKYKMNLQGSNGYKLMLKKNNELRNNIEIDVNGQVLFKEKPEILYTDVKVSQINEHIYETIQPQIKCTNCREILKEQIHYCLFGHVTCFNCKGVMCVLCSLQMNNESKRKCRNIFKGCTEILPVTELSNHEDNCVYNDRKCPLQGCTFSDMFENLKLHLQTQHSNQTFNENHIVKKFQSTDQQFIMLCHNSIFKCNYYYYEDYVEFVVVYFGSTTESDNYVTEILVVENNLKKRCACADWNNFVLDKCIKFNINEITTRANNWHPNFEITLKIIKMS